MCVSVLWEAILEKISATNPEGNIIELAKRDDKDIFEGVMNQFSLNA